jgi:hypothetical protein
MGANYLSEAGQNGRYRKRSFKASISAARRCLPIKQAVAAAMGRNARFLAEKGQTRSFDKY